MDSEPPKVTTAEKKLKQARLPFQIIRVSPKEAVPSCKKLKLDNQFNSPLSNAVELKENIEVEPDLVKNVDEKPVNNVNSQDEDSVQLIESFTKNSPEKNVASEEKSKDNDPCEMEIDSKCVKVPDQSQLEGEMNQEQNNEDCKSSKVSDAGKRRISDDDEPKEKNIVKKVKLDIKDKLSVFAKKDVISREQSELLNNCESPVRESCNKDVSEIGEDKKVEELSAKENSSSIGDVIVIDEKKASPNLNVVDSKVNSGDIEDNQQNIVLKEAVVKIHRHRIGADVEMEDSCSSDNQEVPLNPDTSATPVTPVTPKTPKSKKVNEEGSKKKSAKKLTPKQIQKEAESAKKKEARERELEEKRKKREEEKEEKKRKREEKEEERKKLKEEKERKRQMEIDQKNEEKKRKEEEKRKKEEQKLEEKRKKEEELQKKKEEESLQKKKFVKEAEAFSNFFKKVDAKVEPAVQNESKSVEEIKFMPFTVKSDMRLAPINRNPMDEDRLMKFEEEFNLQSVEELYLKELKSKKIEPKKSGNTWPLEEKYDEVLILEEEIELNDAPNVAVVPTHKPKNAKPKLLQFHENRRPPYWGTWRKKSKNIRARNPFGKEEIFDYEVDSDDEWEEEEPGESLHGSDDEKEPEDDYEVDNDFFVPHGYLSDDENPEDEILSPETQKAKLKLLGEQFDLERNEKTKQLRPITIGCIWFSSDTDEPEGVNPSIVKLLNKRKAVLWVETRPIVLQSVEEITETSDAPVSDAPTPTSTKKIKFPESSVPFLIRLIHGNSLSRKNLIQKFLANWNKDEENPTGETDGNANLLTKTSISKKIKEISSWQECPEEGPMFGKLCWFVKKEIREKYGLLDLSLPNKWDDSQANDNSEPAKKGSPSLITKFTKILSEEERKSQLKAKAKARKSINNSEQQSPSDGKKSAKKLLHFWTKQPNQSQNLNSSIAEDMEVCATPLNDTVGEIKKEHLENSDNKMEVIVLDDDSISKKVNESSVAQVDNCKADLAMDISVGKEEKPEGAPSKTNIIGNELEKTEVKSDEKISVVIEKNLGSENKSEDRAVEVKPEEIKSMEVESKEKPVVTIKPVEKKRVAILFSAPRGCEIKKSSCSIDTTKAQDVEIKSEEIKSQVEAKIDEIKPIEAKVEEIKPLEVKTEELKPAEVKPEEVKLVKVKPEKVEPREVKPVEIKPVEVKPLEKKRVPILFSAPRGCEIKKPNGVNESEAK